MFVCLFVSILWLQEPYAVILDPKKIKSIIVSIISPPICHEVNRLEAISSVHFSSVLFDSLPPHGLQHSRLTYLSITNSQSLFKLMPIESVMPFNHLVLCIPFWNMVKVVKRGLEPRSPASQALISLASTFLDQGVICILQIGDRVIFMTLRGTSLGCKI